MIVKLGLMSQLWETGAGGEGLNLCKLISSQDGRGTQMLFKV